MRYLSLVTLTLGLAFTGEGQAKGQQSLVAPGAKVQKLAGGMKFTEGPVWLPSEKKLVFSDIPNSNLMQWSEAEGLSVYRKSEKANGNILDLEGRLVSCQHGARNIIRLEADGTITVLAAKFHGQRFNSPNDVAVRSDGTLWFTDPPWGLWGTNQQAEIPGHWVYKLHPETGTVEVIVKDLAMPNGIVFSPDENRLYVADTGGHEKHPDPNFRDLMPAIHCYAVSDAGRIGKKQFRIPQGSDGMAVDIQGNLYATYAGKVSIYSGNGKKLQEIDVPEGPANVCFGADEFRTLFITARSSLYSIRMNQPGAKPRGVE